MVARAQQDPAPVAHVCAIVPEGRAIGIRHHPACLSDDETRRGGVPFVFPVVQGDAQIERALRQQHVLERSAPRHGPRGIPGLLVTKRITMQGFIVMDYNDEREKALADLEGWVKSGKLKVPEDIIDGIENTPGALIGLLAGENIGKRMVKVG